jgi:ApaG protein
MTAYETSDTITRGVRIVTNSFYLPGESNPDAGRFVFGYRVAISNEGDRAVQLVSRHWLIIDGDGKREEVDGPGVVGETPRLEPGQSFRYTSFCPIETEWGSMEGSLRMTTDDGEAFDAKIDRFFLTQQSAAVSAAAD